MLICIVISNINKSFFGNQIVLNGLLIVARNEAFPRRHAEFVCFIFICLVLNQQVLNLFESIVCSNVKWSILSFLYIVRYIGVSTGFEKNVHNIDVAMMRCEGYECVTIFVLHVD